MVPDLLRADPATAATGKHRHDGKHRFLSAHQAAVIDAATRRLVPGPSDDPLEIGHPGAHEADVVRYIDTMLSTFSHRVPRIFAGGPWSNRHSKGKNHMTTFVPPDRAQAQAWRHRIRQLRRTYRDGVALLDRRAGGNFVKAAGTKQDQILASAPVKDFTSILFQHTIEGLYSNPEYGGNKHLSGWKGIGFPGDVMPRGYTAAEMAAVDVDVVDPTGIVATLLADFEGFAKVYASGAWRRA
jgi:hypothetical protein